MWKNIKLFILERDKIEPEVIMRLLEPMSFNGEEGVISTEFWREFKEIRINYAFYVPKFVKISRIEDGEIKEEKMKVDNYSIVEVHIKENGISEFYGFSSLIERAIETLETLGRFEPIFFKKRTFERIMKVSSSVKKVVIKPDDEDIKTAVFSGSQVMSSPLVKDFIRAGEILEISGRIPLQNYEYAYSLKPAEARLFVKKMSDEVEEDIEYFVDLLIS